MESILNPVVFAKPKPVKAIKPKKRKVKNSRQLLEIQLDSIVKEIVLERDGGCVCVAPKNGHTDVRQPGHLISRKNKSVKWSLLNVSEQCSGCNLLHVYRPEYYTATFIARWGGEKFYALVSESREVKKYQLYELQELLDQLKLIRERQAEDKEFRPYYTQTEILSGAWSMK